MAGGRGESGLGRAAGIFAGALTLLVVVLALLGHFGLPDTFVESVLGAAVLATFAVAGIGGRTMQTSEFYVAGRNVPAAGNGMAGAAAFLSAAAFLGLAAAFFANARTAIAFVVGWSLGFLILAVAIAPYFRKSGAYGVADFLGLRYGGRAVRLVAAIVIATALTAALAAAIGAAAATTALFGVPERTARAIVVALVLSATVLGGMRALTTTAVFQYIVLALAMLALAVVVSVTAYGMPVPQFAFGRAIADAAALAAVAGDLAPSVASRHLPFAPAGAFELFAAVVSLAAGVAALPHLLMRSATVRRIDTARRSVGWTLLFVLVVALTAPAVAALARLAILADLAEARIGSLPAWVFAYGKLGLVQVCGVDAVSPAAVREACRATQGIVSAASFAPNVAVGGDAIVLALPGIVGLPHVITAMAAAGALAAALAAAGSIALAIAAAIGHDLYGQVIAARASAGRRLIVTRLLLVAVTLAGAWLAANRADGVAWFATAAIALSASGLFPALFLAVWWDRATAPGAVAGMIGGAATTVIVLVATRYPGTLPIGPFDPGRAGLSPLSAAVVGLPVGFIATVAVSLLTPPPSAEQQAILDAIRRPGGAPFVQGGEG